MAFMRIHCGRCGKVWEIYHRDNWKQDSCRQCPRCFEEIDRGIWEKEILPAFNSANDMENTLYNEHTGMKKPLFSIDLLSDRADDKRAENGQICPIIEQNMYDYDIPY